MPCSPIASGWSAHRIARAACLRALPCTRRSQTGAEARESDAACARDARNFVPTILGGPPACGDFRMGAGSLVARGMVMPTFAQLLRARVGRHVVDRTGFEGTYDLELEWSSDLGLQQAPPGAAGATELAPRACHCSPRCRSN